MPVGLPLALGIHAVRFAKPAPLWLIAGTFLGVLWVLALAEEFLFRGVLQPMIETAISNRAAALALTSAIFGLAHLYLRPQVSELAVGAGGGNHGVVLRPRAEPGRRHSRGDGDACAHGDGLEGVLRVRAMHLTRRRGVAEETDISPPRRRGAEKTVRKVLVCEAGLCSPRRSRAEGAEGRAR